MLSRYCCQLCRVAVAKSRARDIDNMIKYFHGSFGPIPLYGRSVSNLVTLQQSILTLLRTLRSNSKQRPLAYLHLLERVRYVSNTYTNAPTTEDKILHVLKLNLGFLLHERSDIVSCGRQHFIQWSSFDSPSWTCVCTICSAVIAYLPDLPVCYSLQSTNSHGSVSGG